MHSSPIARGQLLLVDFFSDNPIEASGLPHWFASFFNYSLGSLESKSAISKFAEASQSVNLQLIPQRLLLCLLANSIAVLTGKGSDMDPVQ